MWFSKTQFTNSRSVIKFPSFSVSWTISTVDCAVTASNDTRLLLWRLLQALPISSSQHNDLYCKMLILHWCNIVRLFYTVYSCMLFTVIMDTFGVNHLLYTLLHEILSRNDWSIPIVESWVFPVVTVVTMFTMFTTPFLHVTIKLSCTCKLVHAEVFTLCLSSWK